MNMYTTLERDIKISEDGKTIYIRHAYDKDSYGKEKFHKLVKVDNNAWRFVMAEPWMREYLTYAEDNEKIILLDTDGLGSPIYIGEQIGDITVGAIINTDAFNIVGEHEIIIIEKKPLVEQLKEKLHDGEARFTYKKKNGEERIARGTLNKEIYGEANEPKGTAKSVPENQVRYFDLDSNGWRSFITENLISVE